MVYKQAKIPTFENLDQAGQFFQNELSKIADAFTETQELELRESFREPERPRDGMIIFADGTHWDPGDGRGPYYFDGGWNLFTTGVPVTYTDADAVDAVGAALLAGTHTGISFTLDAPGGPISATVTFPPSYTNEEAQDAIGAILVDSARIDFTYNDAAPSITADIIANSIGDTQLRQAAAMSVIGRTGNTIGNVADIASTTPGHVLRVNSAGTGMAFGFVPSTTINDFAEAVDDRVALLSVAGTGMTITYNDPLGTLTYATTITQYTDELAQDAVGAMVGVSLTYVDATPLLARSALTGDITAAQDSNTTTLATVNANVGSFGSITQTITFTVNGKGLITAAAQQAIAIPASQVTDFTAAVQAIGDARYVELTGDTMTGPLQVPAGTLGAPSLNVGGFGGLYAVAGSLHFDEGGAEAFRANDFGIGIGAAASASESINVSVGAGKAARLQLTADANANASVKMDRYTTTVAGTQFIGFRARGTLAIPAAVQVNDQLFGLRADGYDGASTITLGRINFTMTQPVPGVGAMGLQVGIVSTPQGSAVGVETLTIEAGIGLSYRTVAFLDDNRLFQLRSTAFAGALPGAIAKLAHFTDNGGGAYTHNGTAYQHINSPTSQTIATDAAFTLTPNSSGQTVLHSGVLTAARIVTLAAGQRGDWFHITRTGAGAFNLDVGGLKNLVQNTWCLVRVNAAGAWYLAAYGAL